jgi:putative transposase
MENEYETLNHTKWECKYHVDFIPKRRRKTLYGELPCCLPAPAGEICTSSRRVPGATGYAFLARVSGSAAVPSVPRTLGPATGRSTVDIALLGPASRPGLRPPRREPRRTAACSSRTTATGWHGGEPPAQPTWRTRAPLEHARPFQSTFRPGSAREGPSAELACCERLRKMRRTGRPKACSSHAALFRPPRHRVTRSFVPTLLNFGPCWTASSD